MIQLSQKDVHYLPQCGWKWQFTDKYVWPHLTLVKKTHTLLYIIERGPEGFIPSYEKWCL